MHCIGLPLYPYSIGDQVVNFGRELDIPEHTLRDVVDASALQWLCIFSIGRNARYQSGIEFNASITLSFMDRGEKVLGRRGLYLGQRNSFWFCLWIFSVVAACSALQGRVCRVEGKVVHRLLHAAEKLATNQVVNTIAACTRRGN